MLKAKWSLRAYARVCSRYLQQSLRKMERAYRVDLQAIHTVHDSEDLGYDDAMIVAGDKDERKEEVRMLMIMTTVMFLTVVLIAKMTGRAICLGLLKASEGDTEGALY